MKQKEGFTLLEVLLVIATIGILAAIVIVAINPNRQLSQVRDTERQSDVNAWSKAMEQVLIDQGEYSAGITNQYQPVCNDVVTAACVDLSGDLVSAYVADVPEDPDPSNHYYIAIHPENNWYGGHATSSWYNTGGTQGSRNFTAGVPVWLDYRMNEWAGGQLARMCVDDGSGYQVFSAANFPRQIFTRQYVSPEPIVVIN